ncbi:YnbE family lipoprotein [Parasphingopyxis sp.]|uniref:YnbE family lipoprotein n=1 Tax=Parasphingopyxis sp. TaxID=1920299 RepID=UPI00262789C3|nr:YnbE family lipoprotein [Parasphingopyxis sp.]
MKTAILTKKEHDATDGWMRRTQLLAAAIFAAMTSGCVQVSAPEEPIVIELNINVQQTVDVNLQEDVENLIENNPELFPE